MLSVSGVDKNIFLKSNSIKMTPSVSAEWNQNIFNPPYLTVAGLGVKETLGSQTGKDISASIASDSPYKHPNFTTKKFTMNGTGDYVKYAISTAHAKTAYKIVTYVMTDALDPIMINTYAQGSTSRQFGSSNAEVNSYVWTKIETYIGSIASISSMTYQINASLFSSDTTYPNIYYTVPEVYETTSFDYQNGSIWSTDVIFSGSRPGESYVPTGNINYNLGSSTNPFPDSYRNVTTTKLLKGLSSFKMPVSPLAATPSFIYAGSPVPIYKHSLMTDISQYRYFVSDSVSGVNSSVSGLYANPVLCNKVVIKFNTYLSIPTVTVSLTKSDGTTITVTGQSPDDTGTLVLYLNGGALSTTRWTYMPQFNSDGYILNHESITKVTVTQTGTTIRSTLGTVTNDSVITDAHRLSLIEISPRLEVDLTDYVMDVSVNKSLDDKNTYMPISSFVTDDASITLSAVPLGSFNSPIPLFSNISNQSGSQLVGLLRKNIKFYINYNLVDYSDWSTGSDTVVNKMIPGGVFYSDSWQENDIDTIQVQCYDVSRYLQSVPASDYVSHNRDAFSVISNLLDLTGFTDYDIDSLYSVCHDLTSPIDMSYYYCNSKDITISDALNQIFLPYQIGAYIDNFGVMRFLSLSNIMKAANGDTNFSIDQSIVLSNGYSINNKAKPGKISLRYTSPKVKQSLSLQNITDLGVLKSPSYIYTTSNDVVWEQQTMDSVGLNYLAEDMTNSQNYFSINQSDLLDLFHTFNLNNNGYAIIEDEVVSFLYKEYKISQTSIPTNYVTVSVKNDIELSSQVDKFIKENEIGMYPNVGIISNATSTLQGTVYYTTYTYTTTPTSDVSNPVSVINVGDLVNVYGMSPESLNVSAQVTAVGTNTFTVPSGSSDSIKSGYTSGRFSTGTKYDVKIEPTGHISNIQRGMFGTNASAHTVITDTVSNGVIVSKDIKVSKMSAGNALSDASSTYYTISPAANGGAGYIIGNPDLTSKVLFYPNSAADEGYNTYSAKFNFSQNTKKASAGIFFNMNPASTDNTYYLEMVRYDVSTTSTPEYHFVLILSTVTGGVTTPIAYSNITGIALNIYANFEKLYISNPNPVNKDGSDLYNFYADPHETFNLRFTKYPFNYLEDGQGSESSPTGITFSVFLNNFEVTGWQIYNGSTWINPAKNTMTGLRKKIVLPFDISSNTLFGAFVSANPTVLSGNGGTNEPVKYPDGNFTANDYLAYVREIYASQKVLKERSINYYYQDREFLNGMMQGQRFFTNYKEYLMQTVPIIIGVNVYDVQYTNGSAVSVDLTSPEYSWYYYPGGDLLDQRFLQLQNIDEYSTTNSTPINTGFRSKFAIVNSSSHMVYLKKDSDALNSFVATLNLWTHESIVPSDPEIIEVITDSGNMSETVQIDSPFIQSKTSAEKLLKLVSASLDNFSKDISLSIFGNPLIEIGDTITFDYPLTGIYGQKYIVHSVSNSFNNGLNTQLKLNMIYKGNKQ